MANNTNAVDAVVAPIAIKQIEELIFQLNEADKAIIKISEDSIKASKSISGISTPSGMDKALANTTALNEKLRLAEIKLQQQREKAFDLYEKNAQREIAINAKNETAYQRIQNSVNVLTKTYQDLAVRKELGNTLTSKEEKQLASLSTRINTYQTALKSVDATIGKNQRNVGNYASGYNALGNSISQLAREAPAFANSAQTGFMAISNNIPAFQDAIMGLRKSGMSWSGIVKEMGSSLFGLTGIISLATTALVVLGPKIIDWVTGTDEAEKATKRLTGALKAQNEQLAINLKGIKYQEQVDLALAKSAGKSAEEIAKISQQSSFDQVDAAKKVTQGIENQMFSMRAYLALGTVKAKFDFIMRRNGNDKAKADAELFRREATFTEANYQLLKKARDKAYQEEKDLRDASVLQNIESNIEIKKENDDKLKDIAEMNKAELLLQLAKNEVLLNNEDEYYSDRITALNTDLNIRKAIAKLDYDEDVRLAKDSQEKKKTALLNYQIETIKLTHDYIKKRADLEKLDLDSITKLTNTLDRKNLLKDLEDSAQKAGKQLEKAGEKADKLKAKLLELQGVTSNWLKSFSLEFLQNSGMGSLETFFDGTFDSLLAGAENTKEEFAIYFNSIAESAQEVYNLINQNSEANFNAEKERLSMQKDISLKYAGENKEARLKIEEDYKKQQADIDYREAKAKQKQAIFNIAIDTAQAIVGALPNIPLSIVVGAIGAAQIAMVASQDIPKYFDGGTHGGGLAMINDAGGSNYVETVITPDGKAKQYSGRDVVANLPKGTEIYTPEQWRERQLYAMLNERGISMSNSNQYNGITKDDLYDVMSDTLGSQPQYHSNFDAYGATDYIIRGGNKTIINKNRGNGRGVKFGG